MNETENMILNIETRTAVFKQQGVDAERLEKGLFAVRNSFHSLFHTVDTVHVGTESVRIQAELKKLESMLNDIDEQLRKRKLIGAGAVAGSLLAALLFYLLRKSFDRS